MELKDTNTGKHTPAEQSLIEELSRAFEESPLSTAQRLHAFARHVRRQDIARFLAKCELFRKIISVNGNIVEGGVFAGNGLASWLHFSAIFEPYNHTRRIIGFDTFSGFPGIHERDSQKGTFTQFEVGALSTHDGIEAEILRLVHLHDKNRPLGHIPKVELVRGDACATIPQYIEAHPHQLISLLYLDFDLYEPTLVALRELYPRMPKGAVVAFDELNCEELPGVTQALLESLDMRDVALERFPYDPYIAYFVK